MMSNGVRVGTTGASWPDLLAGTGLLLHAAELPRSDPHPSALSPGRVTEDLPAHLERVGRRPRGEPWLVEALEEARLAGRGGGHFSAARKWRSALAKGAPIAVVANGAESEPLSGKDATLLRQRPHLVLDGLCCAAETLHAERAVVWLHDSDAATRVVVEEAVAERRSAGFAEPVVTIVSGPSTYLAGESSSIAQALAGGPALPLFRGPSSSRGALVGGNTTLVHNVETLARIALAARECGFDDSRGRLECFAPGPRSTLLTVLTPSGRHVIEVGAPTSLGAAVRRVWPEVDQVDAVLLGGFGGMWAAWDEVLGLEVDETSFRAAGWSLGAGIVAPLPSGACGVAETSAILDYLAASSARQCGPCLFGLEALAASLAELRAGAARRGELRRVAADLEAVRGRGACHHPDGAIRLVATALEVFADDLARHAKGHPCAAASSTTIPVPRVG